MPQDRTHRGFTLIELLVVVAIISLLISILLPSLSKARNVARMVKCQAILKQIGTSNHMYANEAEGWFVPHRLNGNQFRWFRNSKWRSMMGMRPGGPTWNYPAGLICPNVPADRGGQGRFNYGGNGMGGAPPFTPAVEQLAWNEGDYDKAGTASGVGKGIRIFRDKIRNPSGKVQNLDASDWNCNKSAANWQTGWDLFPELAGGAGPFSGGQNRQTSYRHDEGANLLMVDGHVEHRSKAEVFYFNASNGVDHGKTNNLWHLYR